MPLKIAMRRLVSRAKKILDAAALQVHPLERLGLNLNGPHIAGDLPEETFPLSPVFSNSLGWSERYHIHMPETIPHISAWEHYNVNSTLPPTELNHPAYHEMPKWRRKSEAQFFSRRGIELEVQSSASKIDTRKAKHHEIHVRAKYFRELLEADREIIRDLLTLHKLPLPNMILRHKSVCWAYIGAKEQLEDYIERANQHARKRQHYCDGRNEIIGYLDEANEVLMKRYEDQERYVRSLEKRSAMLRGEVRVYRAWCRTVRDAKVRGAPCGVCGACAVPGFRRRAGSTRSI